MAFLVTCEHGSSSLPDWLSGFVSPQSTRAVSGLEMDQFDEGAMDAAKHFARVLRCPLIAAPCSPSVVDFAKTPGQRGLFPAATRRAPKKIRDRILSDLHQPFQAEVSAAVDRGLRQDDLLIHLSVHTFANFEVSRDTADHEDRFRSARRTDLGLLYDPAREYELALCLDWYDDLYYSLPMLKVRRNYPRRGVCENMISSFRRKYQQDRYLGIELQLNRAWCVRNVPVRKKVFSGIAKSLVRLLLAAKDDQEAA